MNKIKKKNKTIKNENTASQNILFSFKHLSNNKKHSFAFFKDKSCKVLVYEQFLERMKELCTHPITDILSMSKKNGFETIPLNQFNEPTKKVLKKIDIISNDSKLTVFRFFNNKYRMVCKSDNQNQHIFNIILFDFNYSAYSHT